MTGEVRSAAKPSERKWRILHDADDVTPEIEAHIRDCVDWFDGEPTMGQQEFIDRLCKSYGGSGENQDDFDLDSYDSPAARRIMRIARAERRERA